MVGHLEVETVHHRHERRALALLEARVLRFLLLERRGRQVLVVVGRLHEQRSVETEQAPEQALVELLRVAGREIGAACGAQQQRVAAQQLPAHDRAQRIGGVARRVMDLDAQLADDQLLAVLDA